MNSKLVSIIIPAWNAEEYIKESLDSALNQTYQNIEVVVVNDGSTDGTENILKTYLGNPKFKYLKHENLGLAAARNTGIKNSSGEFVALLDSDDIFLPEKIEKQVRALEKNPEFDICYSDLLHFTDNNPREFFHHRYQYFSGDLFSALLRRQFINPLTVFIKKSVFDKFGFFDEKLRRSEDWDLWLRFARAGVKFYYLNEILAHYRIRSIGNLSSLDSEPEMKEKNLEIFEKILPTLSFLERKKYHFHKILKQLRLKVVWASLMVGDKKKALFFAKPLGSFWIFSVKLIPVSLWSSFFKKVRKIKHRLLLKKQ